MKGSIFISSLMILLTISCHQKNKPTQEDPSGDTSQTAFDWPGTSWNLISMNGDESDLAGLDQPITLVFDPNEHRVSGSGNCNNYFATYQESGHDGIAFTAMGSTKKACPNMDIDDSYFDALSKVSKYNVGAEKLTLSNSTGAVELVYVKKPS